MAFGVECSDDCIAVRRGQILSSDRAVRDAELGSVDAPIAGRVICARERTGSIARVSKQAAKRAHRLARSNTSRHRTAFEEPRHAIVERE